MPPILRGPTIAEFGHECLWGVGAKDNSQCFQDGEVPFAKAGKIGAGISRCRKLSSATCDVQVRSQMFNQSRRPGHSRGTAHSVPRCWTPTTHIWVLD